MAAHFLTIMTRQNLVLLKSENCTSAWKCTIDTNEGDPTHKARCRTFHKRIDTPRLHRGKKADTKQAEPGRHP